MLCKHACQGFVGVTLTSAKHMTVTKERRNAMPYVTRDTKKLLDLGASPSNPGELNYKVTQEAIAYLMRQEKLSYATISATIASLSDASAELRRRLLDPYEDMKIAENGDVYPDALLDATDQIRQMFNRQEEKLNG